MNKVIFWDFDGTLVKPNERFLTALISTLKEVGYSVETENVRTFLKTVFPWLNYNVTYPTTTNQWWENFLSSLTIFYKKIKVKKEDYPKINLDFQDKIVKNNDYILYEDAEFVLQQCVQLGYKNILLSNNYPELRDMLKNLGVEKYFSDFCVSANIGYEKPRKELFEYAQKIAKTSGGIMVGDNPVADIIGAKNAGMTAVLVHNDCPSIADYTFNSLKDILQIL